MLHTFFLAYILDTYSDSSDETIIQGTHESLVYLKQTKGAAPRLICEFCTWFADNMIGKLDKIDSSFYLLPKNKQKDFLVTIFGSSKIEQLFAKKILNSTYKSLQILMKDILCLDTKKNTVIIQTPVDCTPELRSSIRKEYSKFFVLFDIKKSLLGGMRIFKDSQLDDRSWLGKIEKLQSLTIQK